jgi:hypothetical protein
MPYRVVFDVADRVPDIALGATALPVVAGVRGVALRRLDTALARWPLVRTSGTGRFAAAIGAGPGHPPIAAAPWGPASLIDAAGGFRDPVEVTDTAVPKAIDTADETFRRWGPGTAELRSPSGSAVSLRRLVGAKHDQGRD